MPSAGENNIGKLVLGRFKNQSILIGNNIEVIFVDFDPRMQQAKIAICAPKSIPVHRKEVAEAIEDGDKRN